MSIMDYSIAIATKTIDSQTDSLRLRSLLGDKPIQSKSKDEDSVIFFPEKSLTLREVYDKSYGQIISMSPSAGLSRLLARVQSCHHCLDVCFYSIAFKPFIQIIRDLSRNGVTVRLLLNGRNTGEDGNELRKASAKIEDLKRFGVRIRIVTLPKDTAYMHHKFAIIDTKILINGSLNWTKNAVFDSYNDVAITSDEVLVKRYSEQFEELWTEFW